jgi:hypothetical protein
MSTACGAAKAPSLPEGRGEDVAPPCPSFTSPWGGVGRREALAG